MPSIDSKPIGNIETIFGRPFDASRFTPLTAEQEELLDAALDYAYRGWSVFPVDGKVPAVAGGFKSASHDPDDVRHWWMVSHAGANIGVACTDEFWALDIDPDHGGVPSIQRLESDYGQLSETVTNLTGGGGWHCLFRHDGTPIKNGTNTGGYPGLDVRSDGYIVLPPSMHPTTGKKYEWHAGKGPNDIPIADAPEWLKVLCAKTERQQTSLPTTHPATKNPETSMYGRKALDGECTKVREARDGAQEMTLNKAALKIGSLISGGEIDLADAERELVAAAMEMPNYDFAQPWTASQISQKVHRGIKDGMASARTPMGNQVKGTSPGPSLPLIWASEIEINVERSYLIKGLLDIGAMSVVYGQSNTGKSFFTVDLAAHVAAGLAWRDMRTYQGATVYVASESGESIQTRVWAWCHEFKTPDLPFAVVPVPVNLLDPNADTDRLIDAVQSAESKHGPVVLIVIDTLSRSFGGGDENTSSDMTAFISNIDKLRFATGAHVMVVHHAGKDDSRGARGHSSLRAATDTEISITRARNGEFSIAKIDKQRDGTNGDALPFDLKIVDVGIDQDGDSLTTCVAVPIEQSEAYGGTKLSARHRQAKSALMDYWLDRKPGKDGISMDEFKKLILDRGVIDADHPSLRQRISELRLSLDSKGIISVRDKRIHFNLIDLTSAEAK